MKPRGPARSTTSLITLPSFWYRQDEEVLYVLPYDLEKNELLSPEELLVEKGALESDGYGGALARRSSPAPIGGE